MFERFILASNFKRIESRFSMAKIPESNTYIPSYNILPADKTYVITNPQTKLIAQFEFGLKGLGNKYPNALPFVRAEGDRNLNNDPNYTGAKAIFLRPEFRTIIRTQRCLVLADAFVIGMGNNNPPYLVYLRNKKRPFAFAGIWNKTIDVETGVEIFSFAIITTTANLLIAKLGLKRMPVILHIEYENRWLRPSSELFEILNMLAAYPTDLMNAYPLANKILAEDQYSVASVQPIGAPILTEFNDSWVKKKKTVKDYTNTPTLAERMKISP